MKAKHEGQSTKVDCIETAFYNCFGLVEIVFNSKRITVYKLFERLGSDEFSERGNIQVTDQMTPERH